MTSFNHAPELIDFIERQAGKKNIDKTIFVNAVICYHTFLERQGYKLVYDRSRPQSSRKFQSPGKSTEQDEQAEQVGQPAS